MLRRFLWVITIMNKQHYKKVAAIITAAGDGTRMGGISKSLIKIGDKTAFELVLDAFCGSEYIGEIIVACKDETPLIPLASQYPLPVRFVHGGKTRSESVFAAVNAVSKDMTLYAIHDCARPLIQTMVIDRLIDAAIQSGASCASTFVSDTIKFISKDGTIKTPNRDSLIAVQTPQVFMRDLYIVAMAMAKKNRYTATDDTSLIEKAGFQVKYIDCPEPNIKLTLPQDIDIANSLIRAKYYENRTWL